MADLSSVTVVLVRPTEQGNVGATARAMANTGLSRLAIVDPGAPIGDIARAFAVGAGPILDRIERHRNLEEALAPSRRVVGTTSSRTRQLPVPLLTPRELPAALADDGDDLPTALVFGPERSGLNNDELALCSLLVRVPTAPRQPTLNLAQAVLVIAYELYLGQIGESGGAPPAHTAATAAEIEGMFAHLDEILTAVGFARDDTYPGVVRDLRRLAGRAAPTPREVQIVRGLLRRAGHALDRR